MADHHAPGEQPRLIKLTGSGLAEHLLNGGLGGPGIVRRGGVAPGGLRVQVLQIREIDVHPALQGPEGLHPVIAPGVPHHRNREGLLQHLAHDVGVVGGVDKIDVVGPLADQLQADLPQAGDGERFSEVPVADCLVLAEHTAKRAAREEHGPGAPLTGDGGFLPVVEGRPGGHWQGRHPAPALPFRLGAQDPAPAGTEVADHWAAPLRR